MASELLPACGARPGHPPTEMGHLGPDGGQDSLGLGWPAFKSQAVQGPGPWA